MVESRSVASGGRFSYLLSSLMVPPWCERTVGYGGKVVNFAPALTWPRAVVIDAAMKTLIEGGWVVAYDGKSHVVHEQGNVVYENDRIMHAGGAYTGAVDARLARLHQHARAHHGERRRLPPPRHGAERLPHLQLHELRGAAQGQDGSAAFRDRRRAPDLRVPPRASAGDDHDHRRGRPARRLGGLRAAHRRAGRARVRKPALPRPEHLPRCEGTAILRRGRRRRSTGAQGRGSFHPLLRRRRGRTPARDAQSVTGGNVQRAAP